MHSIKLDPSAICRFSSNCPASGPFQPFPTLSNLGLPIPGSFLTLVDLRKRASSSSHQTFYLAIFIHGLPPTVSYLNMSYPFVRHEAIIMAGFPFGVLTLQGLDKARSDAFNIRSGFSHPRPDPRAQLTARPPRVLELPEDDLGDSSGAESRGQGQVWMVHKVAFCKRCRWLEKALTSGCRLSLPPPRTRSRPRAWVLKFKMEEARAGVVDTPRFGTPELDFLAAFLHQGCESQSRPE